MTDEVLLDEAGYRVTRTRIETPRGSHSLSDVTRVGLFFRPPRKVPAYACLWFGGLLSLYLLSVRAHLSSGDTYYAGVALAFGVAGLVLLVLGIRLLRKARPAHTLVLITPDGDHEVASSEDRELLRRVADAIADTLEVPEEGLDIP